MYVSIFRHRSDLALCGSCQFSSYKREVENPYILLGEINVENTNLVLERTDRIPHRYTQGSRSNEVTDLGRHVMHQVPREGRVARRKVILYNLRLRSTRQFLFLRSKSHAIKNTHTCLNA
jgi:hypothetical protein